MRAERERFGPPSAGAAAGRRRPPGRCGPAPGRAAPRPPPAPAGPRCRPLPYLIWRRRLLIRLSPVSVASSVRLGLVKQRDVIRGGGLEAVPHLPGGSAAPPSASSRSGGGSAPSASPPQRAARSRPAGEAHASPGPKRLSSSSSPAASRSAAAPTPEPGGRQDGPPTPRGAAGSGGSARPAAARRGSASRSPAPCALGFVARAALAPPLTPPRRARGSSSGVPLSSASPGPAAGTALPAPGGTRRNGTDWGNAAACRAPPAPKWWEPLGPAPERGVCLCSGHGGAGGRSGPAGRGRTGQEAVGVSRTSRPTPAEGPVRGPAAFPRGPPGWVPRQGRDSLCWSLT